jgi:hypothetical protein
VYGDQLSSRCRSDDGAIRARPCPFNLVAWHHTGRVLFILHNLSHPSFFSLTLAYAGRGQAKFHPSPISLFSLFQR